MGRKWEDDGDVMEAAIRILVVTYSVERMIQTVRASAMELMSRGKTARGTTTGVAGLPCAGSFEWQREAAPDVAPVGEIEEVNASAMIPALQLNRADRGAE